MRSYTQAFSYDAAGNLTQLKHTAPGGSYTRTYSYNNNDADRAAFGIPASAVKNNQLLATAIGANPPEKYSFDEHGNMQTLPHLAKMCWNFNDEFVAATQQAITAGATGQTTYYNYDGSGTRVRKVTESAAAAGQTPARIAERLYIAGFEIYRDFDTSGNVTLQRETLHIMDDEYRMAMVDTKTIDAAGTDNTTLNTYYSRYQYCNHLNNIMIELDGNAGTISYEEYHPFGTTSYQAMNGALDVPVKRYRYTSKERDEESGLYYHGARYYVPWLGRWTRTDPDGAKDGLNLYRYANNNPIMMFDPNGKEVVDSLEDGLERLRELANDPDTEIEYGLAQDKESGQFSIIPGYGGTRGGVSFDESKQALLGHTHLKHDNSGPSQTDLEYVAREELDFHVVYADEANDGPHSSTLSYNKENKLITQTDYHGDTITGQRAHDTTSKGPEGVADKYKCYNQVEVPDEGENMGEANSPVAQKPATPQPGPQKADAGSKPQGSGGGKGSVSGKSAPISVQSFGTAALGSVGRVVPGVVEGEVVLTGLAGVAATTATTAPLVAPLLGAAEALPVVAGVGVVGAAAGHLAEAGATALGAEKETAKSIGFGTAIIAGAALGSFIPGVGTAVGAGIGALVAGGMYLWSSQ